MKVAFLGLGVMGFPMAGHLVKAGHEVTVYNRTAAKAEQWVAKHGGRAKPTPAAGVAGAEIVFVCVGNDDELRQVSSGADGAVPGMTQRGLVVDHTTASGDGGRGLAGQG